MTEKLRHMNSAPRDGSKFVAYCTETGREGFDLAYWSGKSPDDPIGHFTTKYGWRPLGWCPLPKTPSRDEILDLLDVPQEERQHYR